MKFSERVWKREAPIFQATLEHPFNVELGEGTLSRERFLFYMKQDACYLVEFSRALALIASRAGDPSLTERFLRFSSGALLAERELHARFLPQEALRAAIEPSPACLAYTRYLLATAAHASVEEAVAAVLPCFWVYSAVGAHLARSSAGDNPYAPWIDAYSAPDFAEGTQEAISLCDALAERASPPLLSLMEKAFSHCMLYEWCFWEDAYQMRLFAYHSLAAEQCL
jgi:thiaminase/transcriptional activator TenA